MSLVKILRFINGYLDISVKGDCAEQFINLCTKNNLSVWRVRKELGTLKMRISVKDYKKIRRIKRELKVKLKVKIIKKHGIRFKIHKYRKRKGIAVGLLLFFAFLIFMSNFLWTIEVKGNKIIKTEEILSATKTLGVYEGVYKGKIDTYNLPLKLILKKEGIAWCSFNIEGSKLTIEISESKESEKQKDIAANLVAKMDGVIEKLEITDGIKKVKIGQAVRKGDLLASGLIDNGVRIYTVNADGKVIAKTERNFKFTINKEQTFKEISGRKETRSVISFFGIKLPLYLGDIKYSFVDKLYEKRAYMFGHKLPISIFSKTFEEVNEKSKTIDESNAQNLALELLSIETKKLELYSAKIQKISCESSENEYVFTINTLCSEDICEKSKINPQNELKNKN